MSGNVWNVGGLMSGESPTELPAFQSSFIYLQILLFILCDLSGRSRRTRRVDDGGEAFFFCGAQTAEILKENIKQL